MDFRQRKFVEEIFGIPEKRPLSHMVGVGKSTNPGDKEEGRHNHGKGKGNNTLQKTKDKVSAMHRQIFPPHS